MRNLAWVSFHFELKFYPKASVSTIISPGVGRKLWETQLRKRSAFRTFL